jgi:hypothetical protein
MVLVASDDDILEYKVYHTESGLIPRSGASSN